MSEIDAIFASKAKPDPLPVPSSSKSSEKTKTKKKKKKKGKVQDVVPPTPAESTATTTSKKRPAPETVVDTSGRLEAPAKRHKGPSTSREEKVSRTGKSKISGDDANFKDSRGKGDRECFLSSWSPSFLIYAEGRKTEEGWTVYKEDELGISGEGGGKLLYVPTTFHFTSTSHQTHHYVHSIVIAVSTYRFIAISART